MYVLDVSCAHELPITLGRDFAGVVEAEGEGVSEVEVGDERPFATGPGRNSS
ncbi:alcohol dehydrogenase catalytic domain-containing protein [Streptomyces sp. TRM72054]|uniref:alcohol dehydrogenase catalytic domain-containing protein n=1 Tax=Streptomyces sp. TRM72054 TaxID=2870562 RepID=UPI001C8B8ACF|nr:alcohol dehydrogenase catalytic domain-containing protein [Streptomyces sp. TRM72054]MBX9392968.1 alcohol dehydrogenase catalytic domain-containing protein [Streptomyces sp. TRM72054]